MVLTTPGLLDMAGFRLKDGSIDLSRTTARELYRVADVYVRYLRGIRMNCAPTDVDADAGAIQSSQLGNSSSQSEFVSVRGPRLCMMKREEAQDRRCRGQGLCIVRRQ